MSYLGKRSRPSGRRWAPQRSYKTARTKRYVRPMVLTGLAPARTGGFYGVARRRNTNEKKVIDTGPANYTGDTTAPTFVLLNGCATGTDYTDRIGRKIMIKSIYLRGIITPEDTTISNNLLRMVLVYDTQSNNAAPGASTPLSVAQVLKSATSLDQLNLSNRDRFKILMDKQFAIADTNSGLGYAGGQTVYNVKKFKRCNLETVYSGTTAAIGSIQSGALYLMVISNQATPSSALFSGSVRIRFEDA